MSEMTSQIREHMPVVANCGTRVGTVDHLDGKSIKLTKADDPSGSGEHRFLPLSTVASIKDGEVHLNINSQEVKSAVTRPGD